ncbi:MAG: hypothetical protein IPI64_06890 [Chloracidobacterium sp.]|nr:hypothetical protein [Chloracidobacterium sp.]
MFAGLISCSSANAQPQLVASVAHARYKISSTVLNEERTILVRVPADYERGISRYPVVYMLDAHPPQNAVMAAIIEQQAWSGMMPEMILVGIQNTDRSRSDADRRRQRRKCRRRAEIPAVHRNRSHTSCRKNYRTQPYRIFAGHSLGGLFAMYAFISRPELFNAYIAASPALAYDDSYVIKRTEEILKQDKSGTRHSFSPSEMSRHISKPLTLYRICSNDQSPKT